MGLLTREGVYVVVDFYDTLATAIVGHLEGLGFTSYKSPYDACALVVRCGTHNVIVDCYDGIVQLDIRPTPIAQSVIMETYVYPLSDPACLDLLVEELQKRNGH